MTITRTDKTQQEFNLVKDGVTVHFQECDPIQFGSWKFSIAKVAIGDFGRYQKELCMLTKGGGSLFDIFRIGADDEALYDRAIKLSQISFNTHRSNILKIFSRLTTLTYEQSIEAKKLLFLYQLDYVFETFFKDTNHTANFDNAMKELIKVSDEQLLMLTVQLSIVLSTIGAFSAISLDL